MLPTANATPGERRAAFTSPRRTWVVNVCPRVHVRAGGSRGGGYRVARVSGRAAGRLGWLDDLEHARAFHASCRHELAGTTRGVAAQLDSPGLSAVGASECCANVGLVR